MPDAVSIDRLNQITSSIIDAAIRIHKTVGPGLLESAYFGCLCFELTSAGMRIETQKALPLIHRKQLLTYLRVAHCPLGLVLAFGAETMKEGIGRVISGYFDQ